jgi:hypothetical protein
MDMIATLNAISNMGTDIRLFRRKDRYDLYGRSHRRSNTDDYDANFGDEEDKDDEMNYSHEGHRRWWIALVVLVAVLLIWLGIIPLIALGNYSQANNSKTVAQITLQKTHKVGNEYDVTATVPGSNTSPLLHTIHGDIIVVKLNMIKFLGSSKGYQLGEVTGQSTNASDDQTLTGPNNSFQLGNETDGYLTIVQNNPWIVPTVAVSPCTVQLGPINDFNSHSYDILVSPNGTCLVHQLS